MNSIYRAATVLEFKVNCQIILLNRIQCTSRQTCVKDPLPYKDHPVNKDLTIITLPYLNKTL